MEYAATLSRGKLAIVSEMFCWWLRIVRDYSHFQVNPYEEIER